MTKLIVGKLKRHKGYRKPEGSIVVDRRTIYGNPFEVGVDGDAAECVAKFERWLNGEGFSTYYTATRHLRFLVGDKLPIRREAILRGITDELPGRFPLMDWCVEWDGEGEPDAPCHAVVLARRVMQLWS